MYTIYKLDPLATHFNISTFMLTYG